MSWFEREFELLDRRGLTEAEMRQELIARIVRAVPADDWVVQNVDPESVLVTDCMFSDGVDPELAETFYQLEYGPAPDVAKHGALLSAGLRGAVLGAATRGWPQQSVRFREVLSPLGFGHELRLAAVTGDTPWAMLDLYRRPDRPDFSADELSLLVGAQKVLARTLGGAIARTAQASTRVGAAQAAPATVLLTLKGEMIGFAGPVPEYFAALRSVAHPEMPIPAAILSVALAAMVSDTTEPVRMRVLSQTEGWFHLSGALITAADVPALAGTRPAGDLAITIAPAHGAELAQLRMRAFGLTLSERRVCELVLAGASTKLIASRLHLSPYTVQDQLKSIFAKSTVSSRGELTALLMA